MINRDNNQKAAMKDTPPQRDEVLAKLDVFLRERGKIYRLEALGCFGSVARMEATAESDVDVVYRTVPLAKLTLFDLVQMKDELEAQLGKPVDLIEMRHGMPSRLRQRLEREAAYV